MRAVWRTQTGWPPTAINYLARSWIHPAQFDMKPIYFLLPFTGAVLLCGCNKQTKINGEKIEALSRQVVQLQQNQSKQMAAIQTQLTALTPALDKINGSYFEKSHEDAFFFHTNTLYLLLTVDRKIEAQLQVAETERQSDSSLAYYYHTNQTDTMYFCVAQIENALEGMETRLVDKVNNETRLTGDGLAAQIKLSAPDEAELARRKELSAEVAQIKSDLDQIMMRLKITNSPAAQP
jgi:outer membrane murein-binding lipoprotein Lpp